MTFNCMPFKLNCTGRVEREEPAHVVSVVATKRQVEFFKGGCRWKDYKAPGTMVGLAMVDMNMEKYSAR